MTLNALFWHAYILTGLEKARVPVKWAKQSKDIETWFENKDYRVIYETDVEDCVCFEDKEVFINSRNHPETRYYTLLHEAGHVLISKNWKVFDKEMPMYACSVDGRSHRSKAYRVSTIAEEIEAWKRGKRLAKKLNHFVDHSKYDKHITENIMSYIEWAAQGGGCF